MSFLSDVYTLLSEDEDLMELLTGGIYTGEDMQEITRQTAPEAFDDDKKIKPCALIKLGTELKGQVYLRSVQTPFMIYFYQFTGYDVINDANARAYDLLNEVQVGDKVWNIEYENTLFNQLDIALDCSLVTLRMSAVRER